MDQSNLVKVVAYEMREALRRMSPKEMNAIVSAMIYYHGYWRHALPNDLSPFAKDHCGEVQAGIARVETDLVGQVHYHEHAHVYVICLGGEEHLPDPRRAFALPLMERCLHGSTYEIPPMRPHGFTVEPDGILYFLSVQTPPVISGAHDDYHLLPKRE